VAGQDAGSKPTMMVIVALANKSARVVWALLNSWKD
jgi:arginine decarboxylase-like protein